MEYPYNHLLKEHKSQACRHDSKSSRKASKPCNREQKFTLYVPPVNPAVRSLDPTALAPEDAKELQTRGETEPVGWSLKSATSAQVIKCGKGHTNH